MYFRHKRNTGFLIKPVQKLDYIAGASPIVHEVRRINGDWRDYATDFELQRQNGFEAMNCVTQSVINSVQTQLNWMLITKKLPDKIRDFLYKSGFIVNNRVQLSKKFIAILSETTKRGNYFTKVAQTVREVGVIPETMLPISGSTWDEFYDEGQITEEMRDFGKALFDKDDPNALFTLQYEWVITPNTTGTTEVKKRLLLHELKHAPLLIAKAGHATLKILGVNKVKWQILDSYKPFIKDRAWAYDSFWIMKVVVNINRDKNYNPMKLIKSVSSPHVYLISGDNSKKIMVVDNPTLDALEQPYDVVAEEELERYEDGGTIVWTDRIIN